VKDMLAESTATMAGTTAAGTTKAGAAGSGASVQKAPPHEVPARAETAGTTGTLGEERQMSGMPSQGPVNVTLVDAFSALLAAEQDERGSALHVGAVSSVALWGPGAQAPDTDPSAAASSAAHAATEMSSASADAGNAAVGVTTAAPVVTEAQIEAIVRRVVGEMADRIVREIAGARVLDVAERLVREEIDRLKADAGPG